MAKVLIVDDEEKICFAFSHFLKDIGHMPFIAANTTDALKIILNEKPEIIFLDIRLPGESGLLLLDKIKKRDRDIESRVVVMTAHGTMDTAIQAMQLGADEYLTKPIDLDQVSLLIKRLSRFNEVKPLFKLNKPDLALNGKSDIFIGKSQAIQDIYKMIGLMTTNDVPVLIEGESGVGKELVAKTIHFKSERKKFPFVAINCGAMPDNLLESELFGYEKGAFTGAQNRKIGKFEYAAGGTIFLDEIGDLKFPLQIKLLRVLQEKQLVRIGGLESIPVQARVITATNKNLYEEVESKNFRSDLYYRLQLITLKIPPLRERKVDIPDLTEYFIYKSNRELGKNISGIEKSVLDEFHSYHWPGNVRELENVIKRAAILTPGKVLSIHQMEPLRSKNIKTQNTPSADLLERTIRKCFKAVDSSPFFKSGQLYKNIIQIVEKTMIEEALEFCDHNQLKASGLLGMNRSTFRNKITEYELKTEK
ncbi:MAG: sigma-54-dependent Fis family transcriptional regulator [Desulfobacterales bacterium]|nr:sigma-54-dependent Fis family transcriptional regulator [Desulfobacterales bacterium]